jgi:hypothetical protein
LKNEGFPLFPEKSHLQRIGRSAIAPRAMNARQASPKTGKMGQTIGFFPFHLGGGNK